VYSLSLQTLGCKLNQLESEAVAGAFKQRGWNVLPGGEGADLFVVNTCTVTSKAEQKARRIIRKILRDNPRACLIVTGCYAQMEGEALRALGGPAERGRLFVVPGGKKSALLDLPRFLGEGPGADPPDLPALIGAWAGGAAAPPGEAPSPSLSPPEGGADGAFRFNAEDFSFHTRAFLKIQDGCDHACAYCRVSLARGPSVSLGAEAVLSRLKALEDRGFGEAVLTGVNINQYRDGPRDLGGLLEYLLGATGTIALRLSSVEPGGIAEESTQSFLRTLAHPRIRPHFHLSVQSGSPAVLERMGRRYGPGDIEGWVSRLRDLREDPFLACDIITGFPGEAPADFEKTYELCRRVGFAWIHAFPYSRRPGTAAYHFPSPVSQGEAVSRAAALTRLARQGREAYVRRWRGKTVEAIVETGGEAGRTCSAAVSENYLKLLVLWTAGEAPPPPGRVLRCRIGDKPAAPPDCPYDALAEKVSSEKLVIGLDI
jgi:threonylcarbamoyladenosine tRNA methylthiotransferase MtaB